MEKVPIWAYYCIGNKIKPSAMQMCSQTALASSKKPPCYNEYKVRQPNHYNKEKKPLTIQPIKCVVMLSSDEENDCIAAEKKENKQLKRIMEFADNNNLIPMKVFRRGIFGRRLRDEVFYKAIRYMRAGKADALIVTNLDAISDGIADSYLKIGAVREAGYRLFSVDEKEPKVDLYIPPKRGDLQ